MNYKLEDLVDIPLLQELQDKLNVIYSFPSAIIDNDGKILTAVAWQDICTKFHRQHPECEKECIKSDKYIMEHLHEAKPAVSYQCPHGLIDNATPIIIDGNHLGNFFTGQFFLEKPDLNFFKEQAKKYGFDEEEYIEAVKKTPIWTKEKLAQYLDFIKGFIEIIAGLGLKNLKEIESRKLLQENEKRYKSLFENAGEGIFTMTFDGKFVEVNDAFAKMHGYSIEEMLKMSLKDLDTPETAKMIPERMKLILENRSVTFEADHYHKDGHIFTLEVVACLITYQENSFVQCFHRDITERKTAEEALLESEKKYKALFDINVDGITIFALNGDELPSSILDMNPNAYKMLGYSKEEMLSINPNTIEINVTKEIIDNRVFDLKSKGISEFETTLKHKDGHEINVEIKVMVIDFNNKPALMNIVRDITERKLLEKDAAENEFRFRTFIEQAPMAIGLFSIEGIGLYANPKFLELLNLDNIDKMIGRPAYEYFVPQYREDSKERTRLRQLGLPVPAEYESICVRSDGSEFPVHLAVGSIQLSEGIVSIAFIKDITERKNSEKLLLEQNQLLEQQYEEYMQLNEVLRSTNYDLEIAKSKAEESEEKFRVIIEVSPIPMALNDDQQNITFLNLAFVHSFGYELEDIPTISDWWVKAYPNLAYRQLVIDSWQVELERAKESNTKFSPIEVNVTCKNGDIKTVLVSASSLIKSFEGIHLVVLYDITERKRSESLLIEQNEQLERQFEEYMQLNEVLRATNYDLEIAKSKAEEGDKLKTAFLQNMTHEIRTPLNGILGFSKLLKDEDITNEEIKEYTGIIEKCGNRLLDTVGNVLDISKIETGQIEVQNKPFSINSLITDLFSFFSPQATSKNISFEYTTFLKNDNAIILSDEYKLNQIFTNLINNALKFTNAGKIDCGYTIKDNEIEFYVRDTGIGIPEDMKSRIFVRFAQVNLSITRGYEGAGLGLAICKGLVDLLNGKIWYESDGNTGTTFFFTIPFSPVLQNHQNVIEQIKSNSSNTEIKILIVEDDWTSYQYLSKILSKSLYTTIHAENGQQAIDIVQNTPNINIILMDIRMPLMDGKEATKIIKQLRPDIPIIAQTAYAFSSERDEILAIGCTDYISKPIQKSDLLDLIEKYIS